MILTLVRAKQPAAPDDELEAFCRQVRILSTRDMDGTVTVVFRSMLIEGRQRPVGSSDLAKTTHLNRVTIIHHLQRLEQMGLVEHTQRKYRLRVSGLCEAVEQMREEMMRSFEEAEEMARELDREFLLVSNALDAAQVESEQKQTNMQRQASGSRTIVSLRQLPALESANKTQARKPAKKRA